MLCALYDLVHSLYLVLSIPPHINFLYYSYIVATPTQLKDVTSEGVDSRGREEG